VQSIKKIMSEEGSGAIWKGWQPTAIGYSAQGCFKFGLYEYFKDFYSTMAGEVRQRYSSESVPYCALLGHAGWYGSAVACERELLMVAILAAITSICFANQYGCNTCMRHAHSCMSTALNGSCNCKGVHSGRCSVKYSPPSYPNYCPWALSAKRVSYNWTPQMMVPPVICTASKTRPKP
jgi:Mitochondrial carrier protein